MPFKKFSLRLKFMPECREAILRSQMFDLLFCERLCKAFYWRYQSYTKVFCMIKGNHDSQSLLEDIDAVWACSLFTVNFTFFSLSRRNFLQEFVQDLHYRFTVCTAVAQMQICSIRYTWILLSSMIMSNQANKIWECQNTTLFNKQ